VWEETKAWRRTPAFKDFEAYLLTEFQLEEEEEGRRRGKHQKVDTRKPMPEARHELWDDETPSSANEVSNENSVTFPAELGILGEQAGV
jgi:hypothetical protein